VEEEMLQQQIKVILLRQRKEYLLGKVTELDEEPSLLIENCFEIISDTEIRPFPSFTSQRDMFLTSETVLTILDPSPAIEKLYKKQ
jgi:small nuclear ribonucleoprotein (snRNP)-like protein